MNIIRYVRWRRSPAGREAYRAYAQGRQAIDQVTRVPVPARAAPDRERRPRARGR